MAATRNTTMTRPYLLVVGAAILASLLAVGIWGGPGAPPPAQTPRASLTLRFTELPDGGLSVVNVSTGQEMDRLAEGENGFLRTLLRVVRRDIERTPAVISMPFRIEVWQDNSITLTDSATERRIDLLAFGPTNVEVFKRWLERRNGVP